MKDVECPYCGEYQEICHDDGYGYEEGKVFNQECSDCEKTFTFTTSIHLYYDAEKAPCLNGEEHKWLKITRFPLVLFDKVRITCEWCDEDKDIPWRDAGAYGYDMEEVEESAKEWAAR